MKADFPPTTIDLAREAPFRLGAGEVRPATRELVWGDQREAVEPRVMQVLVALSRAGGEVVSREDLTRDCWGGRIVGDDAINRCIVQLRRIAERVGGFGVETIPRVGYRLTEHKPEASRARAWPIRWLVVGASLGLILMVGALIWTMGPWNARLAGPPRIAVQPFSVLGGDNRLKGLAEVLSDDILGALNQTHVGTDPVGRGVRNADILIGATLAHEGPDLRVRAYLLDARSGYTLWSNQFSRPAADIAAVRDEVAGAVTEATFMTLEPFQQKGVELDPETLALYVKGVWAYSQPDALHDGEDIEALGSAVARNPNLVAARAMLAFVNAGPSTQEPEARRARAMAQVRQTAEAAIRQDSAAAGPAFVALYRLDRFQAPTDLVKSEDRLTEGMAKAPLSPLLQMQACQFLVEVGRSRESLMRCERAFALRPLGTSPGGAFGHALFAHGDLDLARQQLAAALRFHPDSLTARTRRMEIALFADAPEDALARTRDEKLRPQDWQSEHLALAGLFLRARQTRAAPDIQRFLDGARQMVQAGRLPPRYLVLCAATLGRVDVAFETLNTPGLAFEPDGFLFEPEMAPLRRDLRFWPVAGRMGLVRYWRARNVWPDFCADRSLPYDCRAEAARVSDASISANEIPLVSRAIKAATKLIAQATPT